MGDVARSGKAGPGQENRLLGLQASALEGFWLHGGLVGLATIMEGRCTTGSDTSSVVPGQLGGGTLGEGPVFVLH